LVLLTPRGAAGVGRGRAHAGDEFLGLGEVALGVDLTAGYHLRSQRQV
jgi:hypothetical protein